MTSKPPDEPCLVERLSRPRLQAGERLIVFVGACSAIGLMVRVFAGG